MYNEERGIIFDLSREDWDYKGIFFGELDTNAVDKEYGMAAPKGFVAGIMAIIWVDETDTWHLSTRIKYPSGNKTVFHCAYHLEKVEGVNVNETYALNHLYKFPMTNKVWTPNPEGKAEGILKIMKDLDMIESCRVVQADE